MTTAPKTAREAQALADQLAATESALSSAQSKARNVAQFDCWQSSFDDVGALTETASAAQRAWDVASLDATVGIAGLFDAWQALRFASATRSRLVSEASARMTMIVPRRHPVSGQPWGYRPDTADSMDRLLFVPALEAVLSARAVSAANAAVDVVRKRVGKAGDDAAGEVTMPK